MFMVCVNDGVKVSGPGCGYSQKDKATPMISVPPYAHATISLEATVTTHIKMCGIFRKRPKEFADETIQGALVLQLTDPLTHEPLIRQTVAAFALHLNPDLLGYGQIYDLGINKYHKRAEQIRKRLEDMLSELAEQGWDVLPVLEAYDRFLPSQIALNAKGARSISRELVQKSIRRLLPV